MTERHLERAMAYVRNRWFPINPNISSRIAKGLQLGSYREDRRLLIADIRSDLALYTLCLRELMRLVPDDLANPDDAFHKVPLTDLLTVVHSFVQAPSIHNLADAEEAQVHRLQEAVMSGSAAEVLAESEKLPSQKAFFVATIRQLGYILVAWNYPDTYIDAMNIHAQQPDRKIDELLTERLGFSPSTLAMSIAQSWGIPVELQEALTDPGAYAFEEAQATKNVGETLQRICQISEALARANNPERYPRAQIDLKFASAEVERRLGRKGLERIRQRFAENCRGYVESVPGIFKPGLVIDEGLRLEHLNACTWSDKNPYLMHCEIGVRRRLEALYQRMKPGRIDPENIRSLMLDVVPTTRFSGGFVYTVEPTLGALVPQLEIGSVELRKKAMIACRKDGQELDGVALAFHANDVLISECAADLTHSSLVAMAGPIGYSNRVGTLYLELPHQLYKGNEWQTLVHFKALAFAFNACLNLN